MADKEEGLNNPKKTFPGAVWVLLLCILLLTAAMAIFGRAQSKLSSPLSDISEINVYVNGTHFSGSNLILGWDGEIYVPALASAKALDIPFDSLPGKHLVYGQPDFLGKRNSFIPVSFLRDKLNCWTVDLRDRSREYFIGKGNGEKTPFDYSWMDYGQIAHALGTAENEEYTNSKEAFIESYDKGFRLFELDIRKTEDNEIVCVHNWKELFTPEKWKELQSSGDELHWTLDKFKALKIRDKFTPMTLKDFALLTKNYPDIYVILDAKEAKENLHEFYTELRDIFLEINPDLLDRLVLQMYHLETYDQLKDIYPWKSMLYTLYRTKRAGIDEAIERVLSLGMRIVAYNDDKENLGLNRKLLKMGIYPYYYTENDPEKAKELMKRGIYAFYTDSLPPGFGKNTH